MATDRPSFLPDEIQRVESYRTSRKVSLLTIAFSDIVGYTTLCERLSEKKMARILRRLEEMTEAIIETKRGA